MTPDELRALAKARRCKVTDLLVLARGNDPFYGGATPTTFRAAEWFVRELWERFDLSAGVHLRRIHYRALSGDPPVLMPNGLPYENTDECSTFLETSSKAARDCGLVDPSDFVDRKHPAPHLFAPSEPAVDDRRIELLDEMEWSVPDLRFDSDFRLVLPGIAVHGYDYFDAHQPYLLEVWIEKSTQNDILLPLCRDLRVNFVTGVGFQSATNMIRLVERIRATGKPARIFYLSDFDPAGESMPVATARRIEHAVARMLPGADVALKPIVLTAEQVRYYRLPRIPIKATDRRRAGFEESFGEGAVELDALEALFPGELERIVREAVAPYRDERLEERTGILSLHAEGAANDEWQAELGAILPEAAEIEAGVGAILARRQDEVDRLARELAEELAPWRERFDALRAAIDRTFDSFEPDLPALPEPDATGTDESDWLYSSSRDYLAQLAAYKGRRRRRAA